MRWADVIDMRQFSGLKKVMPVTNIAFLCGAGALRGFRCCPASGARMKSSGSCSNGTHHGDHTGWFQALFWVAIVTAILTAFYTFRAYYMTFYGPTRVPAEAFAHAHHGADHGAAMSPRTITTDI